ncbi:MAG: EamA family transporter [Candidatus Dormibacteraceae bacterium]
MPAWQIWTAMVTVYVVWGSTYLGIRIMVRHLPVLASGSARFAVAGLILLVISLVRGDLTRPPARRELASAAAVGLLLIAGGNGGVMLAEQSMASGPTALLISVTPFFIAILGFAVYRDRLSWQVWAGLLVGLVGLAVLLGLTGSTPVAGRGAVIALGAAACWAAGSTYGSRVRGPRSSSVNSAVQMLAGGLALGLAALVTREPVRVSGSDAWQGFAALGYLVLFGSLLGYTAYAWLLRNAPISLVSTYAYVNPVVAVTLGVALLGEPLTGRELFGGAVILAAVAVIVSRTRASSRGSRPRLAAPVDRGPP